MECCRSHKAIAYTFSNLSLLFFLGRISRLCATVCTQSMMWIFYSHCCQPCHDPLLVQALAILKCSTSILNIIIVFPLSYTERLYQKLSSCSLSLFLMISLYVNLFLHKQTFTENYSPPNLQAGRLNWI